LNEGTVLALECAVSTPSQEEGNFQVGPPYVREKANDHGASEPTRCRRAQGGKLDSRSRLGDLRPRKNQGRIFCIAGRLGKLTRQLPGDFFTEGESESERKGENERLGMGVHLGKQLVIRVKKRIGARKSCGNFLDSAAPGRGKKLAQRRRKRF